MAKTASDHILERLASWGVGRVYGYPGDGINGLMGAFARARDSIEFFQVRHEETAAFMACGHAKYTGDVGVCVATSGPGAIHLLNGLYDAKMDHQPVLAIVGQAARAAIGGSYQQEVDLHSLFKDVAGDFVYTATSAVQIRHLIDRALRIAKSQRTVTCVIVPKDVQDEPAVERPPHRHDTVHSGNDYTEPRVIPKTDDLERAAAVLNGGSKVAMLVGAGAKNATDEVIEIAERLGAGIAKALLGKDVVSDELPFVTGNIGLLGTAPSSDMMRDCDTLLMIGTSFPYAEFLPREGDARAVQIDIDPRMQSIRFPVDVSLTGDSRETLRALIPLIERKPDRRWRERIERRTAKWWELMDARAGESAEPLNPELVFREMSAKLPDRCIVSGDAGTATNWFARQVRMRPGMRFSLSGSLATMGSAVPYAIAAKLAYPDRVSIAVTGDGAMQMNGINELITIAKYWKDWADPRLIVLVLNNRDLSQVSWEMRVAGEPKFSDSQDLPDFRYSKFAELVGLRGIVVSDPDDVGSAWDDAFGSHRPVVLEARTDPNVATLPPHISVEQVKGIMSTIVKGDPDGVGVVRQTLQDIGGKLFPKPDRP